MINNFTLTEVIFEGVIQDINFEFLKGLLSHCRRARFNYPEIDNLNFDFIISLIQNSEYIDLAFDSFELDFVKNIFVNLVVDNNKIELLFFMDLKDVKCSSYKEAIDKIINWAKDFEGTHNFTSIICQPDNADEYDFYFKNGSYGIMYDGLD
jgi:hypothetical protein